MIKCSDIMTHNVECCAFDESVKEVAELMKSADIGFIPVVDNMESKLVLGVITDRDLVLKVIRAEMDPAKTRADEVMTRRPITCTPATPIDDLIDLMGKYQVRRMPIVNEQGSVVGVVSLADIAVRMQTPAKTADLVLLISCSKKSAHSSKL